MNDIKYPRIGVGVMLQNTKGEVLLGLRQGSHGAGEWSFPGGHLDFGETIFETAKREIKEETDLDIEKFELFSVFDEMRYIKTDDKHYVNIGVKGFYVEGEPKIMEPNKCKEWKWFNINDLPDNLMESTEAMIGSYKRGELYKFNPR